MIVSRGERCPKSSSAGLLRFAPACAPMLRARAWPGRRAISTSPLDDDVVALGLVPSGGRGCESNLDGADLPRARGGAGDFEDARANVASCLSECQSECRTSWISMAARKRPTHYRSPGRRWSREAAGPRLSQTMSSNRTRAPCGAKNRGLHDGRASQFPCRRVPAHR